MQITVKEKDITQEMVEQAIVWALQEVRDIMPAKLISYADANNLFEMVRKHLGANTDEQIKQVHRFFDSALNNLLKSRQIVQKHAYDLP